MAITKGNYSGSFRQGLDGAGIDTDSGAAQDGAANLNSRITAAFNDPGVPVDNGPAKS